MEKVLLSHTLAMRGSDVAGLVEFHLEGDSRTDRWTDARKNNFALANYEGK